jgi:hypothetical protein
MKLWIAAGLSLVTISTSAKAQTAIQPGLWEVSAKTTMEGVQSMPTTSKRVCVKGGEAILERLLYPSPDEFAKHGCTFTPGDKTDRHLQGDHGVPRHGADTGSHGQCRNQLQARQL